MLRLSLSPAGPYDVGDAVRVELELVDMTSGIDVPVDPTALQVRTQAPGQLGSARLPAEVVYTWPANAQVVKPVDSTPAPIVGSFYLDVTLDRPGTWRFHGKASGAAIAAAEVEIYVERSAFPNP